MQVGGWWLYLRNYSDALSRVISKIRRFRQRFKFRLLHLGIMAWSLKFEKRLQIWSRLRLFQRTFAVFRTVDDNNNKIILDWSLDSPSFPTLTILCLQTIITCNCDRSWYCGGAIYVYRLLRFRYPCRFAVLNCVFFDFQPVVTWISAFLFWNICHFYCLNFTQVCRSRRSDSSCFTETRILRLQNL